VFHADWERRGFGLTLATTAGGLGTVDAFRFALERIPPERYLAATYYERWLTALATRLVERGFVTREELDARVGDRFPLARPAGPPGTVPVAATGAEPRFSVGDAVQVRNAHPHGHTRSPRYVRGKRGTVVRVDGTFALPDLASRDEAGRRHREWAYGVRFAARELWGDDAPAGDAVHVDLWESYLAPA
jgi:nitrile hydratase